MVPVRVFCDGLFVTIGFERCLYYDEGDEDESEQ